MIIVDHLMPYACSVPSSAEATSLLNRPEVPKPLLNNMAMEFQYFLDTTMMGSLNGVERTIEHWLSLTKKAGFKLDSIVADEGTFHYFICSPVVSNA